MRKFFASLLEVLEIAVIAVAAVFIVRTFLVQPFLVSGTSMYPTFSNGDYVLTDELTYRIRPPERGEVVVFHDVSDPFHVSYQARHRLAGRARGDQEQYHHDL